MQAACYRARGAARLGGRLAPLLLLRRSGAALAASRFASIGAANPSSSAAGDSKRAAAAAAKGAAGAANGAGAAAGMPPLAPLARLLYGSRRLLEDLSRVELVRVAGVTFEDRQELLARLELQQGVLAVREPDNEHDARAVRIEVRRAGGEGEWELGSWAPLSAPCPYPEPPKQKHKTASSPSSSSPPHPSSKQQSKHNTTKQTQTAAGEQLGYVPRDLTALFSRHEAVAGHVASSGRAADGGPLGARVRLFPDLPALTLDLLPAEWAERADLQRALGADAWRAAENAALAAAGGVCAVTGVARARCPLEVVPVYRFEPHRKRVLLAGLMAVAAPVAAGARAWSRCIRFSPLYNWPRCSLSTWLCCAAHTFTSFALSLPPPPPHVRAAKRLDRIRSADDRAAALALIAGVNGWGAGDLEAYLAAVAARRRRLVEEGWEFDPAGLLAAGSGSGGGLSGGGGGGGGRGGPLAA